MGIRECKAATSMSQSSLEALILFRCRVSQCLPLDAESRQGKPWLLLHIRSQEPRDAPAAISQPREVVFNGSTRHFGDRAERTGTPVREQPAREDTSPTATTTTTTTTSRKPAACQSWMHLRQDTIASRTNAPSRNCCRRLRMHPRAADTPGCIR